MEEGVGIVGGNADEAVDADFGIHEASGKLAFDQEIDGADAGLFAIGAVDFGDIPALFFPIFEVHAEEHGGPVAGFGAAGAGVNLDVAIGHIVRAGEEGLHFDLEVVAFGEVEEVVGFVDGGGVIGFDAELVEGFDIFDGFFDGEEGLDLGAQALHFIDDFFGGVLVGPEVVGVHFFFKFFDFGLFGGDVKASRGWF